MSIIYTPDISVDLTMWNPNVKSMDDCRVAFQNIYETLRTLSARLDIEIDVGHPHTWTHATYTPTLTCEVWEGSGITKRNPTLGSGGSVAGRSWNLFGWTYASGLISFGAESGRDTGYGKYRITLPSTPYNKGSRWLGNAVLKQQYSVSSGSTISDQTLDYVAVCPAGAAYVEFFAYRTSTTYPETLGFGGNGSGGASTTLINTAEQLTQGALFSWDIWYRTEV